MYCNAGGTIPKGQDPGKPTQVIMPIKAPTKVKTTDIEPGVGPAAKKGNYLVMHYLGMVCSTGQQFQSLLDRYPTHDKAAGALLKLGLSQYGLRDLDGA